ncbi:hypothetical protein C8R43DRAFT_244522 [Mycena crocata]|nr:hypothetical protein C8R43DRAFT_244522 [Mycena crocata]
MDEYIPHRILRHKPALPAESMFEDAHNPVSSALATVHLLAFRGEQLFHLAVCALPAAELAVARLCKPSTSTITTRISRASLLAANVRLLVLSGSLVFDLAMNLFINNDTPAAPLQHIITGAVAALPALTSSAIAAAQLSIGPEPCEAANPAVKHVFSSYRVHRPPGVPAVPLYQLTSDFLDDPENLRSPRITLSANGPAPGVVDINQIRRGPRHKRTPIASRALLAQRW